MKTIILCCTIPGTFSFSYKIIEHLKISGYKVILMSSDENRLQQIATHLDVDYRHIPFYRGMNPIKDICAIRVLRKTLKVLKPDIVVGATPKAGMVSMIGAKLASVKNRVYHVYGLPYETAKGIKKNVLKLIEKITATNATSIIPIGTSVKQELINNKLVKATKIHQMGLLTVGGVDIARFNPEKLQEQRKKIREELGVDNDDIIIGYVARLTYDKGFLDLIDLWQKLKDNKRIHLLIVGEKDSRVPLSQNIMDRFFAENRIHYAGYQKEVEKMFAAMDIFLFPSYREGFGNVSLEASAMKIPVVSYDVTGCRDAVEDGISGYTVPFQDYDAVLNRITTLIENKNLRLKIGEQGRERIINSFTLDIVARNLLDSFHL